MFTTPMFYIGWVIIALLPLIIALLRSIFSISTK